MPFIGDGEFEAIGHHELMMIKPDGSSDVWCYGYQPTTDDIADRAHRKTKGDPVYTMCVQKVGDVYEVYDLKTLRVQFGAYTIGLPLATHENVDAAIMAAVMLA